MSEAAQPVEKPKRNRAMTIILLIVGVIAIVSGVGKMYRGYQEMTGAGEDPKVEELRTASNQAIEKANELIKAAAEPFQALLNDADSLGLDAIRKDQGDSARKIGEQFGEAASQFRLAAKQLDETVKLTINDKAKSYNAAKSKAFGLLAQVFDKNQEIVALVLDESIATTEALTPKVLETAASRAELQKQADAADAEAEAIAKK